MHKRSIAIAAIVLGLATLPTLAIAQKTATAVFAGGCFWTTESQFEKMPGVISAVSGFTGGQKRNPTYKEVVAGGTGHLESVRVTYDPRKVSYRQLVDQFWRNIDPTDQRGQICDFGASYRTAIFYSTEEERQAVVASKAAIDTGQRKGKITTQIRAAETFWPAGKEHQDFARLNRAQYAEYARVCNREPVLAKVWADAPR